MIAPPKLSSRARKILVLAVLISIAVYVLFMPTSNDSEELVAIILDQQRTAITPVGSSPATAPTTILSSSINHLPPSITCDVPVPTFDEDELMEVQLRHMYKRVSATLANLNITHLPFGGTLINLLRYGRMVTDNDLDIIIIVEEKEWVGSLRRKFIDVSPKNRWWQKQKKFYLRYQDPDFGVPVDMVVYVKRDGHIYSPSDNFKIPNEVVYPFKLCAYYDKPIPCPQNAKYLSYFGNWYHGCMIVPDTVHRNPLACPIIHPPMLLKTFFDITRELTKCGYASFEPLLTDPECLAIEKEKGGLNVNPNNDAWLSKHKVVSESKKVKTKLGTDHCNHKFVPFQVRRD